MSKPTTEAANIVAADDYPITPEVRQKAIDALIRTGAYAAHVAAERKEIAQKRRAIIKRYTSELPALEKASAVAAKGVEEAQRQERAAMVRALEASLACREAFRVSIVASQSVDLCRSRAEDELRKAADERIFQLASHLRWLWHQVGALGFQRETEMKRRDEIGGTRYEFKSNIDEVTAAREILLKLAQETEGMAVVDYGDDPGPRLREIADEAEKLAAPFSIIRPKQTRFVVQA